MKKYISSQSSILTLTLCDGKMTHSKKIPNSKIHSELFDIFPQVGKKTVRKDVMSVQAGSYPELFQGSVEVATFQRSGILSNNFISKEIIPQQLECPHTLMKYDIAVFTSLKLYITNSIELR